MHLQGNRVDFMPFQQTNIKHSDMRLQRREDSHNGLPEILYPKHQEMVEGSSDNMKLLMNRLPMVYASSNCLNYNSGKVLQQNVQWRDNIPIGNVSYNDTNKSTVEEKDPSFVLDCDSKDFTFDPTDYPEQEQVKGSSDNMKLLLNRLPMVSASSTSFNYNSGKVLQQNVQWRDAFPIGHVSYDDTNKSIVEELSDFIFDSTDYPGQERVKGSSDNMTLLMNRLPMVSASSNCLNYNSGKVSQQNVQWRDAFPIGNVSYDDTNKSILEEDDPSFVLDWDSSDYIFDPIDCLGQQQEQVDDVQPKRDEEGDILQCGFDRAIQESVQSTHRLQTWDLDMGLKRCHSKTMTNSTNSRKKLKLMFQIKEKEVNDDILHQ